MSTQRGLPVMSTPSSIGVRSLLLEVIERRVLAEGGPPLTAVARQAFDRLAAVLVPIVSQPGFDALAARAFQLAQRTYPAEAGSGEGTETVDQVSRWLESKDHRTAIAAAIALFEGLASLLTALIGESLTMRFLRKAWSEGSLAERSKGKQQ